MMNVSAPSYRRSFLASQTGSIAKFAFVLPILLSSCNRSVPPNDASTKLEPSLSLNADSSNSKAGIMPKPDPGQIIPPKTPAHGSGIETSPKDPTPNPPSTSTAAESTEKGPGQDQAPPPTQNNEAKREAGQDNKKYDAAKPKPSAGTDNDARPPKCANQGSRSEGWQSADGKLLRRGKCADMQPECLYPGSRSEGWYANKELISYARCTRTPSHQPVCVNSGSRSESWEWPDGTRINYARCKGQRPQCKHKGTKSEGWYSGDELIVFVSCTETAP